MEEYREQPKRKSSVISWIILILPIILIIIYIGGATSYKKEVLTCKQENDSCVVEKTNLFNIKTSKEIAKLSDIQSAGYLKERVKGNRYSKGYSAFILSFTLKNNYNVEIFSNIYFDSKEVARDIRFLNNKLREKGDIILEKSN